MNLSTLCLQRIKAELDNAGISCSLDIPAQGQLSYPYVSYSIYSTLIEYTFGEVIEDVRIQFSAYSKVSGTECISLLTDIENLFEHYNYTDGSYHIVCTHRTNEFGPRYNGKDSYYYAVAEFTFKCGRQKAT